MYNLDNIEAKFIEFLQTRKNLSAATIRNYLADFRTFWQWFTLWIASKNRTFSQEAFDAYEHFLCQNDAASATVCRHRATLRLFITFCMNEHLIPPDSGIAIKPIAIEQPQLSIKSYQSISKRIIDEFTTHLQQSSTTTATIRNYTHDVEHFLGWVRRTL